VKYLLYSLNTMVVMVMLVPMLGLCYFIDYLL
jgi:preprotein translocase subunit SecE